MADEADKTADRMEVEEAVNIAEICRKLTEEEASELFGTNATVYLVNKNSFNEA